MINRILAKLFLNEFDKTLYKAARDGHMSASTFFNRDYPDFNIKVNGVLVKVELGRIEIHNGGTHTLLPKSPLLYTLLKRLYKQRKVAEKKRQEVEAYQAALNAIKGNDKK